VRPVAAHRGDVAALQRAFAAGAPVDARDARGRTALHVATFARQHEAIRLLARAGAKLGALENDRYDGTALIAAALSSPPPWLGEKKAAPQPPAAL